VKTVDQEFAAELAPACILTAFAFAYRYPSEGRVQTPLTSEDATGALKLAVWVYEETKNRAK
jgi:hypothetical protein